MTRSHFHQDHRRPETRLLDRYDGDIRQILDEPPEMRAPAMLERLMRTGQVDVEYVEYVLRPQRGLMPCAPLLLLGDPALDGISLLEPDLSLYDEMVAPAGAFIRPADPDRTTI